MLSGFRQILNKELLDIPLIGTINLHAGKLPEYEGFASELANHKW